MKYTSIYICKINFKTPSKTNIVFDINFKQHKMILAFSAPPRLKLSHHRIAF